LLLIDRLNGNCDLGNEHVPKPTNRTLQIIGFASFLADPRSCVYRREAAVFAENRVPTAAVK
jgi:hypothetical protein